MRESPQPEHPEVPVSTRPVERPPARALSRHPDEGFELTGPSTPVGTLVRELWQARALLVVLARKDFFVRYRRTSLGVLWAVGLPLVQALVLTVVFSHVVRADRLVEGRDVPFPVFLYAALVPWGYVAAVLPGAATAIVDNLNLVTKIYFPRVLTVALVVLTGLVPLVTGMVLLAVLTARPRSGARPAGAWMLPGALLVGALMLGIGACLSALHVYLRDVRYLVQALMTVGFYLTPVLYPLDAAPGALSTLLALLPAAGPVELFRAATVGADPGWQLAVAASVGWVVVTCTAGLWLQSRRDRVFTDLL